MSSEWTRRGTYIVPLVQTDLDGLRVVAPQDLAVGSVWRWFGDAVRLDGTPEHAILNFVGDGRVLRDRARGSVRRMFGNALSAGRLSDFPEPESGPCPLHGFTVTDGRASYRVRMVGTEAFGTLLVFSGDLPPKDVDLYVTDHLTHAAPTSTTATGVICFTPGTLVATPNGLRPVETIRPGDRVSTRDDGAQEVLWTGARRMTGARLYAMPHLRPVRIRSGAMGEDRPEGDLIVSPGHRLLVRGAQARALFNQPEVLVAARDLVDGRGVLTETALREVTYIHLMTERHQIVWANGVEAESFHPAAADFDLLNPGERDTLLDLMPGLDRDPFLYGDYARRNLTAAEAAILRHAAA
ncbi:Hint domain-containing protein [Defluviimonas sp. WL0050]|uniref:Hint domain-containing protein n=1 Tax=Albidovulum litorale TaxID=2984134 RepID=A0ABT2ZTA4_9RHOB|nr:Hint domain-containing protein [Defluviimonas sp. WL0050]MCV2874252.1 Hint domain-containing protein [Defluviimonas sp. WL0050]